MRLSNTTTFKPWLNLITRLRSSNMSRTHSVEPPLRSELFSADQMETHGKVLAAAHTLMPGPHRDQLLPRLAANEAILINVISLLKAAVAADHRITPASEWLLDNFYLIEEQIRTAKRHLPEGYSRELPRLAHGPSAGLPRVYDLALETIAHGDGRVDPEALSRFVAAYQTVTALKLGELWAIPIMLRLALIENLRRVGTRIAAARIDRDLAVNWAERMIEVAGSDPGNLILVIADMARTNPPLSSPFVSEFTRRLQGQSAVLALPLTWIEQQLAASELTIEQLVQTENQIQAATQVSVSNSIGSLRFLGAMDWRNFVESLSIVEETLRADPGGSYGKMDFASRDSYRHVIEKIARHNRCPEREIAQRAVQLALEAAARNGDDDRSAHVGYYLIGKGSLQLDHALDTQFTALETLARTVARFPLLNYLGGILLITAAATAALLWQAQNNDAPVWLLIMLGILSLPATSQLAVALVNWLATLLTSPQNLPRMDYSQGIPEQSRTIVVIPTMLTGAHNIEELVEALEVRFLANRDPNLFFALLTDFSDANTETLPEDAPLLQLAEARITALNEKYQAVSDSSFLLLHRPRRWNPLQNIWMGYERKRGKLADLNALLRGDAAERFALIVGDSTVLTDVKYVITLDTDTQLPRDSARQFVGTMAHPLNRPRYDADKQRVCEGYGILQPRVAVSLPGTNRSRYARLYGGEPGIDPYTRTISDVYQDLFGEGSFIGKGIYDVDAFEQSLNGRFAENRILSHDLLEGCYARAGLLSDVQMYEEYPARYSADVSRRHRWIRGDWQLLRWLLPGVPGRILNSHLLNPLTALSRWKLLDNLRRSLVPMALTTLLLLGWTVLAQDWLWTGAVLAIMVIPAVIALLLELITKPEDASLKQHLSASVDSLGRRFAQVILELACLPYEAYYSLDAILRTLWRMGVSKQHLLEWNPSNASARDTRTGIGAAYRTMWIAPVIAGAATVALVAAGSTALLVAGPILLLWFSAPLITWWISRPLLRPETRLSLDQLRFLRMLARKTWSFFDTFVGPDDHWLPPDNFQEHPVATVAHRTSPTNMGMTLLANLSAYDFGYISAGQFLERTANTLTTMQSLERHRGHFYNWYDTLSLQPLRPIYISSVDSGNLAGHLLTLQPGLIALADEKILNARCFHGLHDTLDILVETMQDTQLPALLRFQHELTISCSSFPTTLAAAHECLEKLTQSAVALTKEISVAQHPEMNRWTQALVQQCQDALEELRLLAPWLAARTVQPGVKDPLEPASASRAIPTLRELTKLGSEILPDISMRLATPLSPAERTWLEQRRQHITQASDHARRRIATIEQLAAQARTFADMEYAFLYDKPRHLLAIGYHVDERRLDTSYYDLLASEARFCAFVAIAQGQLPQESWFTLGRQLTTAGGEPVLVSWSGSMFEYLMPLLVMPTFENTLLDQTYQAAVARQIAYGKQHNVPWGISESGYNTVDVHLNYQYRAFGVPGLGLKRGLAEDLVIAPYASALALMVTPEAACQNLQRLAHDGLIGDYGCYEAVDYTPSRLPRGKSSAVVRSFMAHHQGMSLLSLAYLLLDQPMQKRFSADPLFQATMLLLHERIPKARAVYSYAAETSDVGTSTSTALLPVRILDNPSTSMPEVQLLSNGRYHVMVTAAGGGYSRWKDLAVTRWREDSTCDNWGTFCYLRDVASGTYWSNAYQPTLQTPTHYEAIFSEGRAEFRRRDLIGEHEIDSHTEIVVSPEDDIELRRVHITNRSRTRRSIEITSYAEVVLAEAAADALHPAFSNLFVQTEIIPSRQAILCTRRPRSNDEHSPWLLHLMAVHGADSETVSYETDRAQFIGRGNSAADPRALRDSAELSGSEGSVLDPIVAIRTRITLDPEQSASIDMVTGIGKTRDIALSLVEEYHDQRLADRVFELAWTHSQVVLRQINATESDAQLYARLANSVLYANASLRANAEVLIKNRRGQSGLWGYAISGDLPIVLLQISDASNIELVRQMVQAHTYWHLKGLAVDLVIWNEDHAGYRQLLQEQIVGLIAAGVEAHVMDRPGGIYVRPVDQISNEDRILMQSVARAIISDARGTLVDQVNSRGLKNVRVPRFIATRTAPAEMPAVAARSREDLILFNGIGGFTPDGHEYVITTTREQVTPAPWVNVLANPNFGSVISENGLAYTWYENAHEFRLTPWHNDPVCDASGEAIYLRDEESGQFWSPTPLPCRGSSAYVSRHGFGYSVFEHCESGICSELWVYVDLELAVKFAVLKLRNESGRSRRLSATGYVEWVLGDLRPKSVMHVVTAIDPESGALFARNPYNTEFAERVTFFDVDATDRTFTGDRREFLGRNGTLKNPAVMKRARLSGKVGAALDPCAALQVNIELGAGAEREIRFTLGVGRDAADASQLVRRCRGTTAARAALEKVWQYWNHTLGAVQVETPDASLNVLTNGWLLYQTLACRLWARSGYYQSGGAFGFRDQLQDVMALVHAEPQRVRDQLLLCASRQFVEGDVQHWWHPPTGRGVRTQCSDDYLWLPLATCRYVLATGDTGVLDETRHFLDGRPVNTDEDSYYDLPSQSGTTGSLYEHCVRAIMRGLRFGEHGLPLMGTGDWNDGMNLVGMHGKGESVWLGFFFCEVLKQFSKLALLHGDPQFAESCSADRAHLTQNIEKHAWDGEWYRRAYFDDGTPLGSARNSECQIDSISQSWSVLSGAGDAERSRQAMESVDQRLVRRDDAIIQLLDPPFDTSPMNPGYIKGYVPGVRENGGQYTHAAIWTTMAFAALGDSRRAWELLGMINPVNHASTPEGVATYKVEPYVIAADVYAVSPHTGRGGWTWYTGSAGWMYRLIVESLLGLSLEVDKLRMTPCLPADWETFKMHYRFRETVYHINVAQTRGESAGMVVLVDGVEQIDKAVPLIDDRREHLVEVRVDVEGG